MTDTCFVLCTPHLGKVFPGPYLPTISKPHNSLVSKAFLSRSAHTNSPHSMRLFLTSNFQRKIVLNAPIANKKANGMLSLFPEAVTIALETRGPIKADVFPITEKSEKNRNICGCGDTSLIMV